MPNNQTTCRVLVVDERRMLAAGLVMVLEGRPAITEAQSLQDLSALPVAVTCGWDVIVTSETYAGHVLRLIPSTTRVVVIVQYPDVPALAGLLRRGAAGLCTSDDLPDDVALCVEKVASGEMRLPLHLLQPVLAELQRLRSRAQDADDALALLTERERDVLNGLGQGRGRTEIARDLRLSPHTVRTHVQHLLRKLDLHSQMEAAAYARDLVAALPPTPRGEGDDHVVIDLDDHKDRRNAAVRP